MDAKQIIEGYYEAWTNKNISKARSFLSDKLSFRGSIDKFSNADDFMKELEMFTGMFNSVKLISSYFGKDGGSMLYDLDTPTPAGVIRTAEFFTVENGKINTINLVFDATELRKLMPPK